MTNDPPTRPGRGETQTIRWSGCFLDEERAPHLKQSPKNWRRSPASPRDKQYLSIFRVDFSRVYTVIRCLIMVDPRTVCFFFVYFCPELVVSTFGRSISQNVEKQYNYGTFTKKLPNGVVIPQTYNSIVPVPWSISLRMSKRHDTLREALKKKTWAVSSGPNFNR